jgi:hypothetical protein
MIISRILRDVYYIQGINSNLMSLGQFNTNRGDEGSLEWHRVLRIGRESTSLTQRRKTTFTESRFKRRVGPQLGKASANPGFTKSQRLHARLGHPGRARLSGFEKMVNSI